MWTGEILKDLWEEPLNAGWFSISTFTLCDCFSLLGLFKGSLAPIPGGSRAPARFPLLSEWENPSWVPLSASLGFPGAGIAVLAVPEQGSGWIHSLIRVLCCGRSLLLHVPFPQGLTGAFSYFNFFPSFPLWGLCKDSLFLFALVRDSKASNAGCCCLCNSRLNTGRDGM